MIIGMDSNKYFGHSMYNQYECIWNEIWKHQNHPATYNLKCNAKCNETNRIREMQVKCESEIVETYIRQVKG